MDTISDELHARIVFTGPSTSGRTSNLVSLAQLMVPEPEIHRGTCDRVSLAVRAPWSGEPMNIAAETWSTDSDPASVLSADAIVFVADSHPHRLAENLAAFESLERVFAAADRGLEEVPHVIQYNKRDLRIVLAVGELRSALNRHGADETEAVALRGRGVLTTLVLAVHAFSPRRSNPFVARRRRAKV